MNAIEEIDIGSEKPMLKDLSNEQLESRLNLIESKIFACRDEKDLPFLNSLFNKLLSEQVRRDLENTVPNVQNGSHNRSGREGVV